MINENHKFDGEKDYDKRDWNNAVFISQLSEVGMTKLKSIVNKHLDVLDKNDIVAIDNAVNNFHFLFDFEGNNQLSPSLYFIADGIKTKARVTMAVMQNVPSGRPKIQYDALSIEDLNDTAKDIVKGKLEEFRFPEMINVRFHNYLEHLENIILKESQVRIRESIDE